MAEQLRRGLRPVTDHTRASIAELFLDLVFVFAFVQVTTLMTDLPDAIGVLQGLLVLTMLWWSWSLYAWLGNRVSSDYGLARIALLAVTPALFVLAVTTREAFTDYPGGVYTPIWFVGGFVVVRLIYLALRLYATPRLRRRDIAALTVPMVVATALLLAAARLPQSTLPVGWVQFGQVVLWILAIAVDYVTGLALPLPKRVIFGVRHWADRHNLIIIVALGEVLVAIGIAGSDLTVSGELLVAAVLAVVVAGSLEWIYFDLSTIVGERTLRGASPSQRVALARDGYSYLHLPMIAGIMLLALGLKHVPHLVEEGQAYESGEPLHQIDRYAMYVGAAVFLLAHAAFLWRLGYTRTLVWPRLAAATLLLVLLSVTAQIPALWSVGWLAAICVATAVAEFVINRTQRRSLRRTMLDEAENASPSN